MTHPPIRLLILGGTTEASALARALDGRFAPVLSLAGRTARPVLPAGAHRIGGFGGVAGLAAYLTGERINAVVDATHPYALRISANAVAACRLARCPLLRLARPAWVAKAGERWTQVATLQDAAAALGPLPRRVLLTVGRQDLAAFSAAPWHHYLVRSVDPPEPGLLPPRAETLVARGPFTLAAETALLRAREVEVLVTKNSGGDAVRGKLDAARALGVTVVMLDRPAPPPEPAATVAGVAEALAWLHRAAAGAERGV